MNYIDRKFRYTDPSGYDKRTQLPLEKYIHHLWDPLLSKYLSKYIKKDYVVCDLGAGTFEHIQYMEKAQKIYAVEINEAMIKLGSNKTNHIKNKLVVLKEDALCSSVPSKSCDIIWSVGLSEFVDLDILFSEMTRICKHKGTILIQFPNLYNPYNITSKIVYGVLKKPIKNYRTLRQFKKLSKKYNLTVREFVSTGIFLPVPEKLQKYFIPLWRIINFIYQPFQRIFPLGANIFCVIGKK